MCSRVPSRLPAPRQIIDSVHAPVTFPKSPARWCGPWADQQLRRLMPHVPLRIHHSLYFDETAQLCHWHIPESHYLESWGDVRSFDGTVSIIQPLIVPLYQSRTAYELISTLLGDPSRSN